MTFREHNTLIHLSEILLLLVDTRSTAAENDYSAFTLFGNMLINALLFRNKTKP